jgi:hypothetical protein
MAGANEEILGVKLKDWQFKIKGKDGYVTYAELVSTLGSSTTPILILEAKYDPPIMADG